MKDISDYMSSQSSIHIKMIYNKHEDDDDDENNHDYNDDNNKNDDH